MNSTIEGFTVKALAEANPRANDRSIGAILVDNGKLSAEGAERILMLQKRDGMRFGDAAIKLGLLEARDIDQALSLQFDYPYLLPGDENVSNELIAAFSPFSREVEGLRALRSQLMLRWFRPEAERKAIAIVSAGRGEGRSHLAANLAIVLSQLGERTLLIDADMRNPRQHELFKLRNQAGLSAVLSGRLNNAVCRIPHFLDLSVLPAGGIPPNPLELLERRSFAQLLEQYSEEFDAIVLDTPAGTENSDAQTVAIRAGAAALVVRKDRTRMRDATELVTRLSSASARVVGTVLVSF